MILALIVILTCAALLASLQYLYKKQRAQQFKAFDEEQERQLKKRAHLRIVPSITNDRAN